MQSNDRSFEAALDERVGEMLEACTRCGKCVEACPSVQPAGIVDAKPEDVIGGIIELLRTGDAPEASRQWAASCMLSGECISACDEGVNPRFLLAMARVAIAKADNDLPARRRQGCAQRVIASLAAWARDSGAAGQHPSPAENRSDTGQRAWHSNILPLL